MHATAVADAGTPQPSSRPDRGFRSAQPWNAPVGAASIIPFPKWPRLATAGGYRPPPPPPKRPKRVPAQVHRLRSRS